MTIEQDALDIIASAALEPITINGALISLGQTTNATPAAFTFVSMDNDNKLICIDQLIIIGKVDSAEDYYVRDNTMATYTRGVTTVTERGKTLGSEERLTLAVTVTTDLIVSGSDIQVNCTGEAAVTINWFALLGCTIL